MVDTFAGAPISNFTFTVAGTNLPVTVNTPAILRSAALYVGPPPQASVVAPRLNQTLGTNSPLLTVPLGIVNGGGLPLGYWLTVTNASPVVYGAINSGQPGGPAYFWKDYSAIGQDISGTFTALAPPKTAEDEGISGPINIGFAFPFFTNSYSQLYVSPNGFVTFAPFKGDTSTNTSLPNVSAPLNLIAFFWEDLDFSGAGHVYTYADAMNGTFTLQFQNVLFKGTTATVNCELVLKTTGEILAAYQTMGHSNQCTIGAQNSDGTQGITVAFKQDYLQPDFAALLTPTPWLRFDGNAGYVAGSESNAVNLSFNAGGVAYGNYTATVLVWTTDANQPLVTLPVSLAITPLATWRQTYFGTAQNFGKAANDADPANDGIANILAYAFGLDPLTPNPNPISATQAGDYLAVVFQRPHPAPPDISYVPEVTGSLESGLWNSGPLYTSQTVTDNGDGTETVTVTDLAPIDTTGSHFVQILIVPQ